jgi:phenylalanyl-tRNA synthetase beta chain
VAGIHQPQRVAGLAYGGSSALQWGERDRPVDFYDIKGDVEALLAPLAPRFEAVEHPALHPGRSARVVLDGQVIGVVGELHPKWRQAYELPQAPMLFELELSALLARQVPSFVSLPKQQSVTRDLALIVGEQVTHDMLLDCILTTPTDGLLRQARLFDVYRPAQAQPGFQAGERSVAVRLELLDDAAPLTDARSEEIVQMLLTRVQQELSARLRGQ